MSGARDKPATSSVLVAPHVLEPQPSGPPVARALPAVELSRVPCAHEWLLAGGESYRVLSVRHVVGGDVAAELQVERLQAEPAIEGRA